MNINPNPSVSPETPLGALPSPFRIRTGLSITLIGLLVFLVGARPALFDLDRSPVVGFVQISFSWWAWPPFVSADIFV